MSNFTFAVSLGASSSCHVGLLLVALCGCHSVVAGSPSQEGLGLFEEPIWGTFWVVQHSEAQVLHGIFTSLHGLSTFYLHANQSLL